MRGTILKNKGGEWLRNDTHRLLLASQAYVHTRMHICANLHCQVHIQHNTHTYTETLENFYLNFVARVPLCCLLSVPRHSWTRCHRQDHPLTSLMLCMLSYTLAVHGISFHPPTTTPSPNWLSTGLSLWLTWETPGVSYNCIPKIL